MLRAVKRRELERGRSVPRRGTTAPPRRLRPHPSAPATPVPSQPPGLPHQDPRRPPAVTDVRAGVHRHLQQGTLTRTTCFRETGRNLAHPRGDVVPRYETHRQTLSSPPPRPSPSPPPPASPPPPPQPYEVPCHISRVPHWLGCLVKKLWLNCCNHLSSLSPLPLPPTLLPLSPPFSLLFSLPFLPSSFPSSPPPPPPPTPLTFFPPSPSLSSLFRRSCWDSKNAIRTLSEGKILCI